MNAQWKAGTGVLVVFLLGCVAGGLVAWGFSAHRAAAFLQRGSAAYVDIVEHRLSRRLKLDADQKEKVHQFLVENLEKRKELQKQIRPQVRMVNEQTVEEITAILRPEQTAIFHENLLKVPERVGGTPDSSTNSADTNSPVVPPASP